MYNTLPKNFLGHLRSLKTFLALGKRAKLNTDKLSLCLFVCPVCIKVIGNKKLLKMLHIYLSAVFIMKVNNLNKT